MAEGQAGSGGDGEFIESLLVQIDGDITALIEKAEDGVAVTQAMLSGLEPAELDIDDTEALNKVNEVQSALDNLKVSAEQPTPLTIPTPNLGIQEAEAGAGQAGVSILQPLEQGWAKLKEKVSSFFLTVREGFRKGVTQVIDFAKSLTNVHGALDAASMSSKNFEEVMARGTADSASQMERLTSLVVRLSKASGETFESITEGLRKTKALTKEEAETINDSLSKTSSPIGALTKGIGGLGAIASTVFGVVFGITAIKAIRDFIRVLTEAANVTISFQTDLIRMEVAIRAAQRASGEQVGTIDQWYDIVKKLAAEYRILSEVSIVKTTAETVLLTRELGFNQDQMEQTLRIAATLASMFDIEMDAALRLVIQGFTGIGRGLRTYGIFLSRAQLNQEAFNLGLNRTWTELTSQERALVALNVVSRQMIPLTADMEEVFVSLGGQMKDLESRTTMAKEGIGHLIAPIKLFLKTLSTWALETLSTTIGTATRLLSIGAGGIAYIITFTTNALKGMDIESATEKAEEAFGTYVLGIAALFSILDDRLEDTDERIGSLNEAWKETFGEDFPEVLADFADKFGDILDAYDEAVEAENRRLEQQLADLQVTIQRKREDLLAAHLLKMVDLLTEYGRKREDLDLDLTQKLQDLEDETEARRNEILQAYYVKAARLEEDYLLDLRRMRERFFEDMQDAIAKRDVWGAINLIKGYIRDRREAQEDYRISQRRAQEDRDRQLAALRLSQIQRRAEIQRDYERRLQDLEIWLARQKEKLALNYSRALEDLAGSQLEQERTLRESHRRRLIDLERNLNRQITALGRAMAKEVGITAAGARAVFTELFKVFGYGGDIDRLMDEFEARMARSIRIQVMVEEVQQSGGTTPPWQNPYVSDEYPHYREGGSLIATSPTLAEFGEVPELVTFTPLSQLQGMGGGFKDLGILKIDVSADQYFSQDFENQVESSIEAFFSAVIQK